MPIRTSLRSEEAIRALLDAAKADGLQGAALRDLDPVEPTYTNNVCATMGIAEGEVHEDACGYCTCTGGKVLCVDFEVCFEEANAEDQSAAMLAGQAESPTPWCRDGVHAIGQVWTEGCNLCACDSHGLTVCTLEHCDVDRRAGG